MARIDKRTRNRRLTALVVVVAVIVLVPVLLIRWSCGGEGDPGQNGDQTAEAGDVTVSVGERVVRGDAAVTVTAFLPTDRPTLPPSAASDAVSPEPGEGQTFHQAFVWVENEGEAPIRVDPADFTLLAAGAQIPPDLTRSGPAARTMLQGSSLQLILTFIGPAEGTPRLGYTSPWSQGTIIFEGQKKPAGMAQTGAGA